MPPKKRSGPRKRRIVRPRIYFHNRGPVMPQVGMQGIVGYLHEMEARTEVNRRDREPRNGRPFLIIHEYESGGFRIRMLDAPGEFDMQWFDLDCGFEYDPGWAKGRGNAPRRRWVPEHDDRVIAWLEDQLAKCAAGPLPADTASQVEHQDRMRQLLQHVAVAKARRASRLAGLHPVTGLGLEP